MNTSLVADNDNMSSKYKNCPLCGEEILSLARKCKHCGEYLDESNEEEIIWEGNPSMLYYLFHWIVGVLLLPLFGIGLVIIIYVILDQRLTIYTLTTRKVAERKGIISRHTSEVSIRDIRSIYMNQNIIERIFSIGSVQIGSAGTEGIEVEFTGITDPSDIRDEIRKIKDLING